MAKRRRGSSWLRGPHGPHLLHVLESTLGVGIIVQAIDEGPPVTIRALVMFGVQREEVQGTGHTEAEAWNALGSTITSWRAANDKHWTMWGAGGG